MQRKSLKSEEKNNNKKEGQSKGSTQSLFEKIPADVWRAEIFPQLDIKDIIRLKRVNKKFKALSDEELKKRYQKEYNENSFLIKLHEALIEGSVSVLKQKASIFSNKTVPNKNAIKELQNLLSQKVEDKRAILILLTHAIFSPFVGRETVPNFINAILLRFVENGIAEKTVKSVDVENTMAIILKKLIYKAIEKSISNNEASKTLGPELKDLAEKNLKQLGEILNYWLYESDENFSPNKKIENILQKFNAEDLIKKDSELTKSIHNLYETLFPSKPKEFYIRYST